VATSAEGRAAPGGELVDLCGPMIEAGIHRYLLAVALLLMLRPTRSRVVTESRYRPCTPVVQPDQRKII
jgi:hypothetical protein